MYVKGGVAATSSEHPHSVVGADGVVRNGKYFVDPDHPVCAFQWNGAILLMGASTPPLARRGVGWAVRPSASSPQQVEIFVGSNGFVLIFHA
jgi:hypothetical protein